MPRKPTPAGKQRVRTGCLTCRKRRRKCDEQKPRCANCEVKGFTCKYGADLAFVPPRSGQAPGGTRQSYSTITFVDDFPVAYAAAGKDRSRQPDKTLSQSQVDSLSGREILNPPGDTLYPNANGPRAALELNDILTTNAPVDYPTGTSLQRVPGFVLGSKPRNQPSDLDRNRTTQSYLGFSFGPQKAHQRPPTTSNNHETDLLRHFRYHVGPWIDVGDPDCALGVQVLLLSRTCRALQLAILALSVGQRPLLALPPQSEDLSNSLRFRAEAEHGISSAPELEQHAIRALLLLQEILPSGLEQWRSHLLPYVESPNGFLSPVHLADELGESSFWLYFRIDLAASMFKGKPPLVPFHSFLQQDGSPIHTTEPEHRLHSINKVYKHALCLLGHCLALIYGDADVASPQTARSPELAAFTSLRQSHFLSQWTFLWTDCQKWYNERPVEAQQIVDVRGGEAAKIDPEHDSSFPILIYTTPMALVANTVYHITSLLLLSHKPRLLKSLPGSRCFTSHIWHAQSISGIVTSNDSPEQWDPILVASLLLIAQEMTHESQQTVLLERLRMITATTGINLEHEIEALQSVWSIARYDEEPEE
ncbi:hypothetical protein N7462_000682 [Penicillium macrosclerotiorum]|uniref:uncharacterized protein n=1 Tax=Penicillium macrosclerotiorum TaxID=303699 RepID=UPI0025491F0B|nr:uncharacterized protein N7462_000682 [Penicillium macrosclerotiorum]KAJ5698677.1 hypothetical protein N7462_000682 [Penicillium macrosclerotiorum]